MKSYCDVRKCNVEMDDCREVAVEENKKLFQGKCPECGKELRWVMNKMGDTGISG